METEHPKTLSCHPNQLSKDWQFREVYLQPRGYSQSDYRNKASFTEKKNPVKISRVKVWGAQSLAGLYPLSSQNLLPGSLSNLKKNEH